MDRLALKTPGGNISGVAGMPEGGENMLFNVIQNSITILLVVTVILALIFIIWGGIDWVTSGGNKDKVQSAQKKIVLASVGLVIALGAFMIVNIVGELFGITFFGT